MLARLIALVAKEFLALLKDPKSRFVIIGPPVVQLLVFGYAATFDLTHVPFAGTLQPAFAVQIILRQLQWLPVMSKLPR